MKQLASLIVLALGLSAPAAGQDGSPDIKGSVDLSIRWLRSVQDKQTGAYGSGVESTALVLRALAVSPRHYTRQDGPYVQLALDSLIASQAEDGAICDAGAKDDPRLRQTQAATAALFEHADDSTRAALGKALAYLGKQGVNDPNAGMNVFSKERETALGQAVRILSKQDRDGAFDGKAGKVVATARAVIELSAYYKVLKPKSDPTPTRKLPKFEDADGEAVDKAVLSGARFLIKNSDDGKWGAPGHADAGLTSMVIAALQAVPEPRPKDIQIVIDEGLAWVATMQREDGSIHQGRLASYVTSASILALSGAGDRYKEQIVKARNYLITLQADEGEGYSPDHQYYGGIGYGGDERPDLSNLQMALEALAASGLEKDHEAYKRAIKFLDHCQNRSESNDITVQGDGDVVYVAGDDGGAAYMPGNSPAGYVELEDGRQVPRSYGSMTYALLKGFIFAGVAKDDPRMIACFEWLQKNYSLDVNPGFEYQSAPNAGYQGLFYYFHTMARALDLYDQEILVDAAGREHSWRKQLAGRIVSMQSKIDHSWVNENAPRWWEGNPILATSYALLSLEAARPKQ
jgi:squalene-hopene/tetraprenyl-beta-curcumene cyclase